jgi:hypothetical protein
MNEMNRTAIYLQVDDEHVMLALEWLDERVGSLPSLLRRG